MADRFPSIEDIDAGDTQIKSGDAQDGDFLSRERAALGEDAAIFQTNDNKNATIEDADDDLLGGDFGGSSNNNNTATQGFDDDLGDFESSFPAVSTQNDNVGPGGTITGTNAPFLGGGASTNSAGYTNYTPASQEDDTEPIRAWRERRAADVARRDEASTQKREETVQTARKDVDSFYESYNRKVDRQKATTAKEAEEFLAKREDTTAGGTSWERIAKLVDLSGKGQVGGGEGNKKRFRELLINLKGDSEAPGASGI